MSRTRPVDERAALLARHASACDYNTCEVDDLAVEGHLDAYLKVLGIERRVVRLRAGWELSAHPSLARYVARVLEDFRSRNPQERKEAKARAAGARSVAQDALDARVALVALDAQDARVAWDARVALDARAAQDGDRALRRFASWCVQAGGWRWWRWDLSWVTTTFLGARQLQNADVMRWSGPLFEAFVAGAWLLHFTDDTLYWVAKPKVHRDPAPDVRRLHCEDGPALESDVENLYFWHGVLVPAFVVVRPDWITVTHIQTETNAEVRRVMLERYGYTRYLTDCGAQPLDSDPTFGDLYRVDLPDDEPIVAVLVNNSTPEPDGSTKRYLLRCHPELRPMLAGGELGRPQTMTARNAVASTFGMTGATYAPLVET